MVLSVGAAVRSASAGLAAADGERDATEARADAELLLAHVLGKDRTWLFTHAGDPLDDAAALRFEALVERRRAGEPVAYLVGQRGFWRFDLEVTPDTLIPRADTECLVEQALARLPNDRPLRLLDLGTGTGAIALALANERPRAGVVAVDLSPGAAAVARRNALRVGVAERVEVREGAWFAPVAGERFDLIASNPPYIEDDDPHLAEGDLRFEPRSALASGADGLDDLRLIVRDAPAHLRPGGWLLVEHGWQQGTAVRALFDAAGFNDIGTVGDLEGRDRVTLGRHPA
ncbi:peptide chain release factor N(5)-glutamine methyltransferase [Silanimonas sp.]|jgi:release factor glutamine methyltransferase|uniref:peptide chain release factor N(5)-glutamine methyltransferase n=1 Tax=Silanimonas sp. TaxID=1929290 RepID=UPI0037C60723